MTKQTHLENQEILREYRDNQLDFHDQFLLETAMRDPHWRTNLSLSTDVLYTNVRPTRRVRHEPNK